MRSVRWILATSLLLFLLLATSAAVAEDPSPILSGDPSQPSSPSSSGSGHEQQKQAEKTVERCHARELSPAHALFIMVVLALGCTLQLSGFIFLPVGLGRSRFYRLAPEVGVVDTGIAAYFMLECVLVHGLPIREAATTVMMYRYALAKDDLWWSKPECKAVAAPDPSAAAGRQAGSRLGGPGANSSGSSQSVAPQEAIAKAASNCYDFAKPAMDHTQTFHPSRLVIDGLVVMAIIKAYNVRGSFTLVFMAISYAASFLPLEIISLLALRSGTTLNGRPRTLGQRQREAAHYADLLRLLSSSPPGHAQRNIGRVRVFARLVGFVLLCACGGVVVVAQIMFPPTSAPAFILVTYNSSQSASGKWYFMWLAWLEWSFWLLVFLASSSAALYLFALVFEKPFPHFTRRCVDSILKSAGELTRGPSGTGLLDIYTFVKTAVVFHYFTRLYTGVGTTTADWLHWLV